MSDRYLVLEETLRESPIIVIWDTEKNIYVNSFRDREKAERMVETLEGLRPPTGAERQK